MKRIIKKILPKPIVEKLVYLKNKYTGVTTNPPHFKLARSISNSLPKGINIVGYTRIPIGIGEAGRSMIRAVDAAGIAFGVINVGPEGFFNDSDNTWAPREIPSMIYNVNLIVANADQTSELYAHRGPSLFNDRFNIGHWAWELPDFPDDWLNSFKFFHEIWVGSSHTRESILRKSTVPVVTMPYSIELKNVPNLDRSYFDLPENKFLFLSMYDTYSFQARKNPKAAIEAFNQAFGYDNQNVGLVIKVNNAEKNPQEWESLKKIVEGRSNIYLTTQSYSRGEINALLNCVDSFISLHRAEGFGLGLAEAMYLGKPVIGTNWSGNTQFMDINNSCAVNYQLVKVGQNYGPYKAEQIWAEPDLEHAVYYMKKLVDDHNWAKDIALKGQDTIRTDFSPQRIGEMITQRLKYLNLN